MLPRVAYRYTTTVSTIPSLDSGSSMKFRHEAMSEQLYMRHLAIAKHFLHLDQ